jgi:hypothetical protein
MDNHIRHRTLYANLQHRVLIEPINVVCFFPFLSSQSIQFIIQFVAYCNNTINIKLALYLLYISIAISTFKLLPYDLSC